MSPKYCGQIQWFFAVIEQNTFHLARLMGLRLLYHLLSKSMLIIASTMFSIQLLDGTIWVLCCFNLLPGFTLVMLASPFHSVHWADSANYLRWWWTIMIQNFYSYLANEMEVVYIRSLLQLQPKVVFSFEYSMLDDTCIRLNTLLIWELTTRLTCCNFLISLCQDYWCCIQSFPE